MDDFDLSRFIFAFLFVLALIGCLALALKRFGRSQKWLGVNEGEGRVKIVEVRHLDPRRRLVLVSRDEVEHLILVADGRETVIESGIKKNRSA